MTWPEFWEDFHLLWGKNYDKALDKPRWREMQLFLEKVEREAREPMQDEMSPKTKVIAAAAEGYARVRAVDGLDFERLRTAFLEGAACGIEVMCEIHTEVTQRATSK